MICSELFQISLYQNAKPKQPSFQSHNMQDQIAGTLEIGEVYGPLYTEEGNSIFKLIDKRQPKDTLIVVNYDTYGDVLNKLIASLADDYGVSVKPEILKAVDVTYINTIVVRFLGFNNRILAVPLLERNVDWLRFIYKKNLPLP